MTNSLTHYLFYSGLSSIVFALAIDKLEFNKDVLDFTFNEPIIYGGIISIFKRIFNLYSYSFNFFNLKI